ncbi:MAG: hypothetical protein M0006_10240 [Magnetospirillum sp.]|nr:hypothetical protein [Magnetospirillum sp.]
MLVAVGIAIGTMFFYPITSVVFVVVCVLVTNMSEGNPNFHFTNEAGVAWVVLTVVTFFLDGKRNKRRELRKSQRRFEAEAQKRAAMEARVDEIKASRKQDEKV